MFLGYQQIFKKVSDQCREKVLNVLYGKWYGTTIRTLILFYFWCWFIFYAFKGNWTIYAIIFIISVIWLLFYISTRNCGFGMGSTRFIYVRFKHLGYKVKEKYEIKFDKIRSIDVKKIIFINLVKISFIDEIGTLRKIKFMFNHYVIGLSLEEHYKNSMAIKNKLVEMQKVLDRGDF